MATRVQEVAKLVVDRYGGKTEAIWTGATTGAELLGRVKELPGFGEQKAKIFVALLGKQLGVRPQGWEEVSAPFSDPDTFRSVADITDTDTLDKVRAFKQALKAANKAKSPPEKAATPTKKARRPGKATAPAASGPNKQAAASKATATTRAKTATRTRTPASASAGKR
jgi:hypothetical protein